MFAVQLQKLGFHQLRRIIVTGNAEGLAPGTDGFKDQVYNLVQTVAVIGQLAFQNVIADVVLDDLLIHPVCFIRFLSFPFRRLCRPALRRRGGWGKDRNGMGT